MAGISLCLVSNVWGEEQKTTDNDAQRKHGKRGIFDEGYGDFGGDFGHDFGHNFEEDHHHVHHHHEKTIVDVKKVITFQLKYTN